MEQAAEILDDGLDIFEERVASHDDRVELLARVVEAAADALEGEGDRAGPSTRGRAA